MVTEVRNGETPEMLVMLDIADSPEKSRAMMPLVDMYERHKEAGKLDDLNELVAMIDNPSTTGWVVSGDAFYRQVSPILNRFGLSAGTDKGQAKEIVELALAALVVDSGQASLSYTRERGTRRAAQVVDSGQASLSYTFTRMLGAHTPGCGQRAGVTQLY